MLQSLKAPWGRSCFSQRVIIPTNRFSFVQINAIILGLVTMRDPLW